MGRGKMMRNLRVQSLSKRPVHVPFRTVSKGMKHMIKYQ
jgi:hypothetical protein